MSRRAADHIDDALLRSEGVILKERIDAMATQIDGQRKTTDGLSAEARALRQGVDLYARHVETLIRERDAMAKRITELEAELARVRSENEHLRAGGRS